MVNINYNYCRREETCPNNNFVMCNKGTIHEDSKGKRIIIEPHCMLYIALKSVDELREELMKYIEFK